MKFGLRIKQVCIAIIVTCSYLMTANAHELHSLSLDVSMLNSYERVFSEINNNNWREQLSRGGCKSNLPLADQYIEPIFQRLIKFSHLEGYFEQRGFGICVNVIPSKRLNDTESQSSNIYFSSKMLLETKNEDEVALILSHELAHVILLHQIRYLGCGKESDLVPDKKWQQCVDQLRQFEKDADEVGLEIVANAGYSTTAAIKIVRTFHMPKGSSTYPPDKQRLANWEDEIQTHGYSLTVAPTSKPKMDKIVKEIDTWFKARQ